MAEKSDHQAITIARGGGKGVDAGAKDVTREKKGEECQQVVTGWETVEFEDTEGTEKAEGGEEAKLQCKSSDSDSDSKSDSASKSDSDSKSDSASDSASKSDSASDSASKSGSDSGTITLKEKNRTKKTKGKRLKEKIKEKLSGKKSNDGVEVKDVKGGVKAEKLSQLLGKLQCDSSDSDSGSGNDSNTLKDERSDRARKKGLLKKKLNRKMEEKEKKNILHAELVASEDEARETKKIEKGEEDKTSLPNQLQCDSSHSGFDSGSSSDKSESKGQGEKAKKMKDSKGRIKEKLGIQNTDKEDEKATMVGHEAEKETTVVGESTTAVAEKEGDVQGSKEKKGILEKIMEKLPNYRKNNEDEGEKKVVAN